MAGQKPGVSTMYESKMRLKKGLASSSGGTTTPELNKDDLKLLNKGFRIVTKEIPDESIDLVLALNLPA